MARLKIPRKVTNHPIIKGFKPYGLSVEQPRMEPITLNFEEYEAFRMCDYDMYNHHQASALMNVSRPTFTRIYASARMKISRAFVEGRQIEIEGGKVYFDSDWFRCNACHCHFNNPDRNVSVIDCPLCGSTETERYSDSATELSKPTDDGNCVCPKCGYATRHTLGVPCRNEVCPNCSVPLIRKQQ
ncbi:MAG: DUF134 domain-containing protein [Bacteroidales bacterium]|nr:DUF134 domain-containing protein [Bacteroidales bacterium]